MKHFVFFVIGLMLTLDCSAHSFSENFFTENNNLSFGIHFGAIGQRQEMGLQIFMGHVSYRGFYLDVGGWPQDHAGDVRVERSDADKAFLFHVGYMVPITNFLRIGPLFGYASNESGYTDGHNWTASSSGIHNKFVKEWSCKGFDPGFQLAINLNHFNMHGTLTKYAWYAGIGYEIRF